MLLFDIELKSQKLREKLRKPLSFRLKLTIISDFLFPLLNEKEQQLYTSYYIEFEPELRNLILKKNFDYLSPDEIDSIIIIISAFKSFQIFADKKASFEDLLSILNQAKEKILAALDGKISESMQSYSDSINIVLIETDSDFATEQSSAIVEKLKLESLLKPKDGDTDRVFFNNKTELNDSQIIEQLSDAVVLAKSKCIKEGVNTHSYNFNFYFDRYDCLYSGKSLGIGALSLAYNSILLNENHKIYYKFKDDTVFTAEVDNRSILQKLDRNSLKIKLNATFFSEYKKFVIPEDNIIEAKEELAILNEKYPNRTLELIPIKDYESVFKNLDIVEVCRLNIRQKIKVNYLRYHTKVNISLAVISLSILIYFIVGYLIPHLDRNPVTASTENNRYVAFNKYGIKVWESELVEKTDVFLDEDKKFFDTRFIITDLENDGTNEILYLIRSTSDKEKNRTLYCYNSDNILKWKFKVPEHKINYDNTLYEDNFFTHGIYPFDSDNDGYNEIFCSGMQNIDFPFVIMKLDHRGKLISEYWSSGFLDVIEFYDIDGDGKKELIAGDCNDKFNQAAIAIFDPEFIDGNSPQTDPLNNGKKGNEKYYIIFPQSILCIPLNQKINNVRYISQLNGEGLDVNVYEGYQDITKEPVRIIYNFDKNMKLTGVDFSSPFIGTYKNFVAEGRIDSVNNLTEYAEELKSQVKYWDGEKFVNYPAMNKNYLSVKEEK